MLQDVFLFSGTIRSNIVLREEGIPDEEILRACRYVNADSFINKLEGGLDEKVRERGNNFSAGQRQLLSFARTIVHRPSVMILDEATANIDTETEILIQDSLEKMMRIGTMLMVAHRLSTIRHADKIFLIQDGRILEEGTHAELLQRKGKYYRLYTLQYERERRKKADGATRRFPPRSAPKSAARDNPRLESGILPKGDHRHHESTQTAPAGDDGHRARLPRHHSHGDAAAPPAGLRPGRRSCGPLTALFTATSATCVTGLAIHDTWSFWSPFGQVVILALVELGGLGFMSALSFFLFLLRKKIGVRQRTVMAQAVGMDNLGGAVRLQRLVLWGSLTVQGVGAVLLTCRFLTRYPFGKALWLGVFHSVSAFCNAGFDILGFEEPAGIAAWGDDPLVMLTVAFLIIIGGIGFLIWQDVLEFFRRRRRRLRSIQGWC